MVRAFLAWGATVALVGCFSDAPALTPGSSSSGDGSDSDASASETVDGSTDDPTTGADTSAPQDSTSTASSDGPTPDCTAAVGVDPACDAATPYCVDGGCVGCSGLPSGCAGVDPAAPYCDPATELCAPCSEHDHCDAGACRIKTGECVAESNRLWVDADATCLPGLGTEAAPFCTFEGAIEAIEAQANDEPFAIFVDGSASIYSLWIDSPPAQPIVIIGPSAGIEARFGTLTDPVAFIIGEDREIYLAHVTLESPGGSNSLLDCQEGELWIDDAVLRNASPLLEIGLGCEVRVRRSVFSGAMQHAVIVESGGVLGLEDSTLHSSAGAMVVEGTVNIDRSYVHSHYMLGGMDVLAGSLRMTNSLLWSNVYAFGNIRVSNAGSVELVYVTSFAESVACDAPAASLTIRNSAIQDVGCAQATIDHSLVGASAVGQGEGNVEFPVSDAELEEVFEDPLGGDLHLEETPPEWLLGIAVRGASDPPIDIDGDARPRVGDDDYPGADVP